MLTLSETIRTLKEIGCSTHDLQRVRIPVIVDYDTRFRQGFRLRPKHLALEEESTIRKEIVAGTLMRPKNILIVGPTILPELKILCSFFAGWHEYGCARANRLEEAFNKRFGEDQFDEVKSAAFEDFDEIRTAIANALPDSTCAEEDLDLAFPSIEEAALYGVTSEILEIGKPERYWQLFHRMIQTPFVGWDEDMNLCILASD